MTVSIDTITTTRPLESLPPAAREALARVARTIEFKPGERLIPLGQSPQRLVVLTGGLVKLVGVSANGHERILYVHRPGDLVGPSVLLDNFQQDYEATAMSAGTALAISRRDLLMIGRSHPAVILTLAQEVSRLLAAVTERMMAATSSEVPVRLSHLLLEFARGGRKSRGDLVPLSYPLTHESMAQIVGASRPHTSTVLRDLEAFGAVQRKSADGLLVRPNRLREIVERGEMPDVTPADGDRSTLRPQLAAAFVT